MSTTKSTSSLVHQSIPKTSETTPSTSSLRFQSTPKPSDCRPLKKTFMQMLDSEIDDDFNFKEPLKVFKVVEQHYKFLIL